MGVKRNDWRKEQQREELMQAMHHIAAGLNIAGILCFFSCLRFGRFNPLWTIVCTALSCLTLVIYLRRALSFTAGLCCGRRKRRPFETPCSARGAQLLFAGSSIRSRGSLQGSQKNKIQKRKRIKNRNRIYRFRFF